MRQRRAPQVAKIFPLRFAEKQVHEETITDNFVK